MSSSFFKHWCLNIKQIFFYFEFYNFWKSFAYEALIIDKIIRASKKSNQPRIFPNPGRNFLKVMIAMVAPSRNNLAIFEYTVQSRFSDTKSIVDLLFIQSTITDLLKVVTTCDLVTILQRPFFNLLHKIIRFSNIMQLSDSFCGDQKCH